MSYSVAQNTSFLTLASILQKVISSVYFIIIARTIGIGNTGDYFTIIASIAVFAVVADFGFAAILTREAAQYPEKLETYMRAIFGTKLVFGVITFGLIIGSKMIFNYPSQPFPLVYLAGLTMFFDNLQTTFYGALRSRKNLLYEALGIILSQALTLSIGTLVILNHWPLMWLIAAYTIPSFIINLYSALIIRIKYKFSLIPTFNWNVFKSFFIMAWPFALAGIISRFYAYNDSIIMTKVLTQNQIGAWAAAYKVAAAFQFIPITLSVSVFPAMSSLALLNKQKVVELFERSLHYLFLIAFPVSLGGIILAEPIILKFYKAEFRDAIIVLQFLMISLIFGFTSFVSGAVLNAIGKQKTQTFLMLCTLIISLISNLICIPRWGIQGAAYAAVVSSIFLSLAGIIFVHKNISINYPRIILLVGKIGLPAGCMALVVQYFSDKINFLFTIPLGAVVYGILLLITGGISWNLIKEFKGKILVKKEIPL